MHFSQPTERGRAQKTRHGQLKSAERQSSRGLGRQQSAWAIQDCRASFRGHAGAAGPPPGLIANRPRITAPITATTQTHAAAAATPTAMQAHVPARKSALLGFYWDHASPLESLSMALDWARAGCPNGATTAMTSVAAIKEQVRNIVGPPKGAISVVSIRRSHMGKDALADRVSASTAPAAGQVHFLLGEFDPLVVHGCLRVGDFAPVARVLSAWPAFDGPVQFKTNLRGQKGCSFAA